MKSLKIILLFSVLMFGYAVSVRSQCAMCTLNAENSTKEGNMQGKGLNDGILFLLAIPYIAAAGLGFLWYKKYRKKNTTKRKFLGNTDSLNGQ